MPDKEQIIIDGKGCRYKTWEAECSLTGDHYGDNMEPCKFIDEKSCYFKQLARKTQELEQYKASKQASYEVLQKQCNELELQNRKLMKECEELKEKQKIIGKAIYKESIELCNENARYRKALEEIEGIIDNRILDTRINSAYVIHDHYLARFQEILDIINKAKGEGNEG